MGNNCFSLGSQGIIIMGNNYERVDVGECIIKHTTSVLWLLLGSPCVSARPPGSTLFTNTPCSSSPSMLHPPQILIPAHKHTNQTGFMDHITLITLHMFLLYDSLRKLKGVFKLCIRVRLKHLIYST